MIAIDEKDERVEIHMMRIFIRRYPEKAAEELAAMSRNVKTTGNGKLTVRVALAKTTNEPRFMIDTR